MDSIPARQKRNHHNKSNKHHKSHRSSSSTTTAEQSTELLAAPVGTNQIKSPTDVLIISEDPNRQFSKRNVSSNWDKYTESESSNDFVETTVADFEQLLIAPSSIGGHFLFNSEKNWEANDDWYNRDEYFNLNLMELEQSLNAIPFYERQNYAKDVFTAEEIEDMEREAKRNQIKRYAVNSKNTEKVEQNVMEAILESMKVHTVSVAIEDRDENDEDELDELLNLTGTKSNVLVQQNIEPRGSSSIQNHDIPFAISINPSFHESSADSKDDIQRWLDDVLDG